MTLDPGLISKDETLSKFWNGEIVLNLGASKTISDNKSKVNRDINEARNVLLRAFSVA